MICHNNYLVVMKRFTFINKSYVAPQIKGGRCNIAKQATKSGEPIVMTSLVTVGSKITMSSDGKYIEIGDDISVVKVYAQLNFALSTEARGTLAIRRKNSNGDAMVGIAMDSGNVFTVSTLVILNVSKGDQIYLATTEDAVLNPSSGGGLRSGLIVEKIA